MITARDDGTFVLSSGEAVGPTQPTGFEHHHELAAKFWLAGMIDTALEHIEKHKGRSVLYEMDKAAALDDLSAVLYKEGPLNITIDQLDNLFSDIWQNHQRHRTKKRRIYHLLIEGRSSVASDSRDLKRTLVSGQDSNE